MKKILFVLPWLEMGGMEKLQVNLANALVNQGYEITLLILSNVRTLEQELDKKVKIKYKPLKYKKLQKIPYFGNRFFDDGMWETRATPKQLHDYYVGDESYDVEIAFFRGLSVKIVSGCNNANTIKLAWVHSDFRLAKGFLNNFKCQDDAINAYKRFDRVVCVSKEAQEGFIEVFGDTNNLTHIFNYLPTNKIEKLSCEKEDISSFHKFNVIMVGRLVDGIKGQVRLISAINTLRNEGLDIDLTLVGEGADRGIIEEKIKEINGQGFVHLLGNQQNPYPYIKRADLLVCASYYEGYNLTVAEALILGTPVMSTDCTGPREILDNGKFGLLVENSEQGLKEGLKSLYLDNKLLQHYKDMAKHRRDFFAEETILFKIEKLFCKGDVNE